MQDFAADHRDLAGNPVRTSRHQSFAEVRQFLVERMKADAEGGLQKLGITPDNIKGPLSADAQKYLKVLRTVDPTWIRYVKPSRFNSPSAVDQSLARGASDAVADRLDLDKDEFAKFCAYKIRQEDLPWEELAVQFTRATK